MCGLAASWGFITASMTLLSALRCVPKEGWLPKCCSNTSQGPCSYLSKAVAMQQTGSMDAAFFPCPQPAFCEVGTPCAPYLEAERTKRRKGACCRLVCSLMMHGRNSGKKLMAVRIVKHSFDIIKLTTDSNPVQILVDAIINGGPREDATRIGSAGVVRRQAVDVSPMRRVNQALYLLTTGAREATFRNIKTVAECLADELINAAKGSSNRFASLAAASALLSWVFLLPPELEILHRC
jgi:ribosomal protein uS7